MDDAVGRTSSEGQCEANRQSWSLPVVANVGCGEDWPDSFADQQLEGGEHRGTAREDSLEALRRTDYASVLGVDAVAFDFHSFLVAERMHMSEACSRRPCLLVLMVG